MHIARDTFSQYVVFYLFGTKTLTIIFTKYESSFYMILRVYMIQANMHKAYGTLSQYVDNDSNIFLNRL